MATAYTGVAGGDPINEKPKVKRRVYSHTQWIDALNSESMRVFGISGEAYLELYKRGYEPDVAEGNVAATLASALGPRIFVNPQP